MSTRITQPRIDSIRIDSNRLNAVADWCEALARGLRAGESLVAAVERATAPPLPELATLRHHLRRGAPLTGACTRALEGAEPLARETLGLLRVAATGGVDPAQGLDRLAHALRLRAAVGLEIRTQTAAVRLSAVVLSSLPPMAVVLTALIAPGTSAVLLTRAGLISLGLAAVLNLLGWVWIRRLIRAAAPR